MLKFSFLIALYNGEKYLSRCLYSLLEQDISYDEYEIICLDDCSPDGSSDVVRSYQKRYPNIRLYKNDVNCRIATNVNKLIQLADGKYFWIIGQDDYIEPNCLNMIYQRLEQDKLDVLVFNYRRVNQNEQLIENINEVANTYSMTGVDWIKDQYRDRNYCYYILGYEWRSIYRTEYWKLKGISCVDGLSWEDTVIMMKAIVYSSSVASISNILYNYRRNEGSISYSSNHIKRGDYIFEFSFLVGDEVEQFYYQLLKIDDDLASKLYEQVKWRYNCFVLDLIRTTLKNKKLFYSECNKYKYMLNEKSKWLNLKSKLAVVPLIGFFIVCILNVFYSFWKGFHKLNRPSVVSW